MILKELYNMIVESSEGEEMYDLLYPEERKVSHSTIMSWAEDAFANDQIDHKPVDIRDALDQLEDAGIITTKKRR